MTTTTRKFAAAAALCGAWLMLAGCEDEPTHQAEGLPTGESTPERRDGLDTQDRQRADAPDTGVATDQPAAEPTEPPPAGGEPPAGAD